MRNPDNIQLLPPHLVLPAAPLAIQLQLDRITRSLYETINQNLVGVYLHGSLAMGCFNAEYSDIDLLAITHHPLATGAARTLYATLLEISGQPRPVEISILHYAQLKPWRYPTPFDLHFSEMHRPRFAETLSALDAQLPTGGLDHDLAAHFTVLYARGLCVYGETIASLDIDVPWADYLDSLRLDLAWAQQLAAADAVYAVLNACRIWAAVEAGVVLSKAEGARWASSRLPTTWRALVEHAARCYAGTPQELPEAEVRGFLNWVCAQVGWV